MYNNLFCSNIFLYIYILSNIELTWWDQSLYSYQYNNRLYASLSCIHPSEVERDLSCHSQVHINMLVHFILSISMIPLNLSLTYLHNDLRNLKFHTWMYRFSLTTYTKSKIGLNLTDQRVTFFFVFQFFKPKYYFLEYRMHWKFTIANAHTIAFEKYAKRATERRDQSIDNWNIESRPNNTYIHYMFFCIGRIVVYSNKLRGKKIE